MPGAKINLPIFGEVDKKYAAIGGISAGVIVAAVYLRNRSKKAAAASAAAGTSASVSGTSTDPAGNVGVIDPQTGYVYGSPEDTQALSYGQGGGYGGYGGNSNVDPQTGYTYGSYADTQALAALSGTPAAGANPTGITTNSQWLTDAVAALPGDSGTNTTAIASVLGGLTVTTDQKNLFMEAVGILGPPPQGYPTPIKTSDTAAQPGSGPTGGGGGGKPPFNPSSVVGRNLSFANSTLSAHGIETAFVYVQGQGAPLAGAAATVPYDSHIVTAIAMQGSNSAILTVAP